MAEIHKHNYERLDRIWPKVREDGASCWRDILEARPWCASREGLALVAVLSNQLEDKISGQRRRRWKLVQFSSACFFLLVQWGECGSRGGTFLEEKCEMVIWERGTLSSAGEVYIQGLPKVIFFLKIYLFIHLKGRTIEREE